MRHLTLALLIGATLSLGASLNWWPRAAAAAAEEEAAPEDKKESLLSSKLVNLNDILAHQQALVEQCKRLEATKVAELRQLMAFKGELDARITLKLPAVCLMLIGPPQPADAEARAAEHNHEASMRLDLVNWIYDRDELAAALESQNSSSSRTKRQTSGFVSADDVEQNSPGLLNDYWLDLNKLHTTTGQNDGREAEAEAEEDGERRTYHEQVNRMLDDERFKAAILQTAGDKLAPYLSPVVLIPGLAASRLQARLVADKPKVNIICSNQKGWQEAWLVLKNILPLAFDCWVDNIRLEFDPVTGFTRNSPGVETRVPDFGSVESVRHLDKKSPDITKYLHHLIEHYEQLGYRPQRNLFAAPYDFRLAPQQIVSTFFKPLKQLIEFAFNNQGRELLVSLDEQAADLSGSRLGHSRMSGAKKVTLVCHSMGCTHLLIFLRRQTAAWRQSRIRKVIALASPWGGSVQAFKALLVGEQFGLPLVSESKMRKLERGLPAVAYLMPQEEIFERPSMNEVDFGATTLVQTPDGNFGVHQMGQLLKAANLELQWQWFKKTSRLIKPLEPLPDVQVDCLHGSNVPTPETIVFRNSTDFPDGDYEVVNGDGDGTVNHQSLLVCALWASQLPGQVRHKVFTNVNHMAIIRHNLTMAYITDDVLTNN